MIKGEEARYFNLLERANNKLPKDVENLDNLTGKEIGIYHHTYGFHPDLIQDVLDFKMTEKQKKEYRKEINNHKKSSN